MTATKPKRQGNYKPGPGRPKGSKNKKTLTRSVRIPMTAARESNWNGR